MEVLTEIPVSGLCLGFLLGASGKMFIYYMVSGDQYVIQKSQRISLY